jgi:hypothetical protein
MPPTLVGNPVLIPTLLTLRRGNLEGRRQFRGRAVGLIQPLLISISGNLASKHPSDYLNPGQWRWGQGPALNSGYGNPQGPGGTNLQYAGGAQGRTAPTLSSRRQWSDRAGSPSTPAPSGGLAPGFFRIRRPGRSAISICIRHALRRGHGAYSGWLPAGHWERRLTTRSRSSCLSL